MKKTDILFIGLMLFSMFFGAGNLIFPPFLGASSGTSFWPAIAGFIVTGVGLPILVLAAVSLVKGGAETIGARVHPTFSKIFMIVIYLSIGPFLAIPRNANVAYEMGFKPYLGDTMGQSLFLFLFTVVFFLIVYAISMNPEKMETIMSRWSTPTLLLSIVILCIVGFVKLDAPFQAPTEAYATGAFSKGFIEGYNTMDALAALAFGIVILTSIQKRGISDRKQLTKYTIKAGMVTAVFLSIVYTSLGFMGARMAANGTFENGTDILTAASTLLLGPAGTTLLGIIFLLACIASVVGLTTACGHYFSNLIPKASYKTVVLIITLIGFTLSNLGLNQILKVSLPFLVMAYPLTIVLVALTFFSRHFKNPKKVYRSAMLFTGVFALIDGLSAFEVPLGIVQTFTDALPLSAHGMEWILPALVGTVIGIILSQTGKAAPAEDMDIKTI
ncbi:branched-chain amino acid transport system II carrier protein [Peribacillus sp. NPDC097675]|uniref:branched-chain amino acid transport system II carrier protein n=1 Tax=Peribacillus sp. NPDC097675 TaxID=3390618 RepID=UPI003D052C5C